MVSIVVLARNRPDDVEKNLPILAAWAQETKNEIIVVDNASTDETLDVIRAVQEIHPELRIVENKENLGVGGGRNSGFELARGDVILCLDDDSDPDPLFLHDLERLFAAYPEAGIITPKIVHAQTGELQNPHGDHPCFVANFHGCCHAFTRHVADAIGLQDADCTFGGEELDYSVRANKVGFKTLYHPDYVCRHNSFQRAPAEQMQRWTNWVYNYSRVIAKNFEEPQARRFARNYIQLFRLKFLRAGQKDQAEQLELKGWQGYTMGRKVAEPCPQATARFYGNPQLMPEFGNASVIQKALLRSPLKFLVPGSPSYPVERRTLG